MSSEESTERLKLFRPMPFKVLNACHMGESFMTSYRSYKLDKSVFFIVFNNI